MPDAIHRYEVPVDDRWHPVQLAGDLLHVACRNMHVVEVWAMHTDGPTITRTFRVYGPDTPYRPAPNPSSAKPESSPSHRTRRRSSLRRWGSRDVAKASRMAGNYPDSYFQSTGDTSLTFSVG